METWVVMGIDKATHVREGQSGVLAQEGHDAHGCRDFFIETPANPPPPVCGKCGDILASNTPTNQPLQFHDKALPAVAVPL